MSSFDACFFESKPPVELVKAALRACFTNGWAVLLTAAVMLLPATALNLAFAYLIGRTGALEALTSLQGGQFDPTKIDMREFLGSILLVAAGGMAVGAVGLLSSFAAAAAVGRMLAERALGREYGPAQAWDFVLGKVFRLIGGGIVQGIVLFGGYIIASIPAGVVALIVTAATGGMTPGAKPSPLVQVASAVIVLPLIAAIATYVVSMPSIVAVEDLGGISAVFRSFRLVAGRFRHAFAAIVLGGLIAMVPAGAVQMVMQFGFLSRLTDALGGGPGTVATYAPGTLLGLITSPILFAVQAFIYFDLRSRQTEEDFTPYELTLEVGGELPEGVQEPLAAVPSAPMPASPGAADSPAPSDMSRG